MKGVFDKHPRPWRVADPNNSADVSFFCIQDALGEDVIASSEWLFADLESLFMVVSAVNDFGAGAPVQRTLRDTVEEQRATISGLRRELHDLKTYGAK